MLEHALAYAALGWQVFPVHTAEAGICSCHLGTACDRPAKHPRTAHGLKDATTDEATIRAWWAEWPDAGIAVATGVRSGVLAVDFDRLEDATWPHELRALFEANTPAQETGGGGRHVLLRADRPGSATRVKAWPGVDLRGDGGYIVVAPSIHASGRRYVWLREPDHEVATVPDVLEAIVFGGAGPITGPAAPAASSAGWRQLPAHEVARIRSALGALDPDCGRDEWIRVGMALKSTGAGDQALALWDEWSSLALRPGKYDPRQVRYQWTRLAETRPGGKEVTLAALFGMALEAGWVEASMPSMGSLPGRGGALPAPAAPHKVGLERQSIFALRRAPEPSWLVEDLIAEGELVLLFGASQSFKTFVALDLAASLVFGRKWEGLDVRAGSVLYLPGEGRRGLGRRMDAWMRAHPELSEAQAKGYFEVTASMPGLVTPLGRAALRATLEELAQGPGAPALLIIDTLSWAMGGADENEAAEVAGVLGFCGKLREDFGTACLILHHVHKGARGVVGLDAARGSSALGANVDVALQTMRDGQICAAHVVKSKDGEVGRVWYRRFEITQLGVRPNGKPITSGWLAPADAAEAVEASETELRDWMRAVRDRWKAWEPKGPTWRELEAVQPPGMGRNAVRRMIQKATQAGYLAVRRGADRSQIYSITAPGMVFSTTLADLDALREGGSDHG